MSVLKKDRQMSTLETGSPFISHIVWSKAVHLYSVLKTSSPYSEEMQSMSIQEAGGQSMSILQVKIFSGSIILSKIRE
jgi:hypothetical protein